MKLVFAHSVGDTVYVIGYTQVTERCTTCNGEGFIELDERFICPRCTGIGALFLPDRTWKIIGQKDVVGFCSGFNEHPTIFSKDQQVSVHYVCKDGETFAEWMCFDTEEQAQAFCDRKNKGLTLEKMPSSARASQLVITK